VKVLILHQHFNTPATGGAIRSYYLAKALVDHQYQVSVITGYNGRTYKTERIEGIDVHYLPVPYANSFGFWKRAISFLRYNFGVARHSRSLGDVAVCYAISVPLTIGLAAYWLKRTRSIPFIFEVGDLWPEAPIQMGFIRNYFLKKFLFSLEKFFYREAEAVVALSPMIKSSVEEKTSHKTIHLIPNMADTNYYMPVEKSDVLVAKFGVKNKFVVSYIGAIGLANGLDYYIECARACQNANQPVHFIMCGDGALVDYFTRVVKQYHLENFTILPLQSREGVRQVLNVTDATFICYKPLPILETGSPNKYFDGLAAGKLIVINFGGWIRQEIEQASCGVYTDSKYPTDFVKKISPYVQDRNKLKESQQAARSLAESRYSRKILAEKFASIFTGFR
jgi:glycosyltransferase involved in cell wall biosynthesis